ncbi:CBS domain-containing protein [Hydrogenophaga sp.]|uniref:CBS domain-containing protein n=1 Tax=Hydrogenophaga sp. TaxID=1904254 RepID=UPI003F71DDF9
MTRGVRTLRSTESIVAAAEAMREMDVGSVPVCDDRTLVGIVTDRDLVVRALAEARSGDTPISDVMSSSPCWCFEDQSVDEVAQELSDQQIRRVPVLNRDKQLVGILSLGDLASKGAELPAGRALEGISEPTGSKS